MGVRAIDVSRWQGLISWPDVAASGVRAAWVKVGGADDGFYKDRYADRNLDGAAGNLEAHGTYYFCVPDHDPEHQADHAVNVGHGDGLLPPAADVETNPHGLSQLEVDQWVTAFCAEVHHLTGRESIVYTYSAAGLVGYTPAAPSHCHLWIANYGRQTPGTLPPDFTPATPPAWDRWDAWQFNSVTTVPGIQGDVDQNVISDDLWALVAGGQPEPMSEEDHMDTLIVDARPDTLSAWLLSGRWKTWVPTSAYGDFLEGAVHAGLGDLKIPPAAEGGILQGGGSPWIARLDLAGLTNPDQTPVELGGRNGTVDMAALASELQTLLDRYGIGTST